MDDFTRGSFCLELVRNDRQHCPGIAGVCCNGIIIKRDSFYNNFVWFKFESLNGDSFICFASLCDFGCVCRLKS